MADKKRPVKDETEDPYAGLDEATAGWDPYVSALLSNPVKAYGEERRRRPRDKSPNGRRAVILNSDGEPRKESRRND